MLTSLAESIIVIYVLIGIANFASHVLTCRGCQDIMEKNLALLFTGVLQTFGWPFQAYDHFKKVSVGIDRGGKDETVMMADITDERGRTVETLRGNPGESTDQFIERVKKRSEELRK